MDPENADDEVPPPDPDGNGEVDADDSDEEDTGVQTRSGRTNRPRNMEAEFPAIYGDTNVVIEDMVDPICIRPYYQDDDLNRHIGPGVTYPASFFSNEIKVTELDILVFEEQITSLDGVDQYSLFQ